MSEDIRTNEVVEFEGIENEGFDYADYEDDRGGLLKTAVVAGGTLIIGGATAFAIKKKDKIAAKLEERRIRKLESNGYVVERPVIEDGEVDGGFVDSDNDSKK